MKYRVLMGSGLLCALSWLGLAHAQEGPVGYREALQWLWGSHPQLQAKRQEVRSAELGTTIAERQHWPTPSVSANSGPRFTGSPNTGDTRAITAQLSIPIFSGGLLTAEQHIAALRWQLAELDLAQTTTDLSSQLVDLYRQWWQAQARVSMVRQSLARLQDLRVMMGRRAQAGVSSDNEVALTDAHIARFRDEVSLYERTRDVAQSELGLLVGRSLVLRPEALGNMPPWPFADSLSLTQRINEVHPALRYSEVQHAIALKDIDRTKASAWPTVSLRAERQWGAYLGSVGAGDRVYLNSQVSLGAGLTHFQQREQAVARADAAERQIAVTRQRIDSIAMRLFNEHEQAMVQLRNTQALVSQYDDITDANLRLFASGRRSWLDLLNLQREQHQLRLQLADAQSGVVGARLRMAVLADGVPGLRLGQP
jgi:adhesin transport system outer membrane protein